MKKNIFQDIICKLYYKYCFTNDKLGQHIICYYVPRLMRKLNGELLDGSFLFAQIEEQINGNAKLQPLIDIHVKDSSEIKINKDLSLNL